MKKNSGTLYNVTSIQGTLEIEVMKNTYYDYTNGMEVNASVAPILYVGEDFNSTSIKIDSEIKVEESDRITYIYQGSVNYNYFRIVNESSNAQYLVSISWLN